MRYAAANASHMASPPATWTSFLQRLFLLISILVSLLPPSSGDPDEYGGTEYSQCGKRPLICGNRTFEVSYPFNDNKSPPECGHPGFQLICDAGIVDIEINGKRYRVRGNIDYDSQSLTLVDESFVTESCPWPVSASILDQSLFHYSDLAMNVTFCKCTEPIPQLPRLNIPCHDDDTNSNFKYYWPNNSLPAGVLDHEKTCRTTWGVWMDKKAVKQMMDGKISYQDALRTGFTVTWTPEVWQNCSDCIKSDGICGSRDGKQLCFCRNLSEERHGSCASHKDEEPGRLCNNSCFDHCPSKIVITIEACACAGGLIVVCLVGIFFYRRRNRAERSGGLQNKNKPERSTPNIKGFINDYGSLAPKAYRYSDLKKITKSFHDKLGQGGYGSVYRGQLRDGRAVAVKILDKSKESGAEFINEVASISRTSHVNIVSLLGFCLDGRRRALVYEFMPNGSLDKYIYSDEPKALLPWDKLYQIAIGIAHGLEYLHRGCSTRIVHFDIKPHNILLDEDFRPKISDFGLAKLCPHMESKLSVTNARGTIGFIAPEVFSRNFGEVSTKSDVYSYGMMVLEMVGGRRNVKACDRTSEVYFPHWVYEHIDRDEDLRAYHVEADTAGIARRLIKVGLWCIQTVPAKRPPMSRVLEMLGGTVGDLEMPAKPFICSPVRSPPDPVCCQRLTLVLD